jgi:hypothetical protein
MLILSTVFHGSTPCRRPFRIVPFPFVVQCLRAILLVILSQMGLVKMSIENRSNLDPDSMYSLYHYSHPPLLQRLSAIDEGMKKKA